jgi:predicted nucleic acid-binding protein
MAQEAASLRSAYRLRPLDALVIGTAIVCQVRHLITNDHEWPTKLAPIEARIGVITLSGYLIPS